MRTVRLIHWNAIEAEECVQVITDLGYEVVYKAFDANELRNIRKTPPNAVVIDLSRLPSQGRDLGINLRKHKTTRYIPLIFVGGDPTKVGRIKEILPDAIYTHWDRIGGPLKQAISKPLEDPVVPGSLFEAYSGVQLLKKLGITPSSVLVLVGAPENIDDILGELPEGVTLGVQVSPAGPDHSPWGPAQSRFDANGVAEVIARAAGESTVMISVRRQQPTRGTTTTGMACEPAKIEVSGDGAQTFHLRISDELLQKTLERISGD